MGSTNFDTLIIVAREKKKKNVKRGSLMNRAQWAK